MHDIFSQVGIRASLPRLTTIRLNANVVNRLFNAVNQLIVSKNRIMATTKNIVRYGNKRSIERT